MAQEKDSELIDRHPLITLGVLTAGTQLGSTVIQKMAKHPLVLFTMGVSIGVYSYKNRKEILAEAEKLKEHGKNLISVKIKD
jgi:hypothetical protein